MNGLHPIIRRKRRPLIEPVVPPVAVPQAPPVQPVVKSREVKAAKIVKPDDDENTSSTAAP